MVTCEMKLLQNDFSLCQRPSEIILLQRAETCLKLFQNCFTGLLQLTNISDMFTVTEIILKQISELFRWLNNFIWVSDVVTNYMWNGIL